jgi:hypothetical protein
MLPKSLPLRNYFLGRERVVTDIIRHLKPSLSGALS